MRNGIEKHRVASDRTSRISDDGWFGRQSVAFQMMMFLALALVLGAGIVIITGEVHPAMSILVIGPLAWGAGAALRLEAKNAQLRTQNRRLQVGLSEESSRTDLDA